VRSQNSNPRLVNRKSEYTKLAICQFLSAHQWRSQGKGVGAIAPVGLDSDKSTVGSVVHAAELRPKWKWKSCSFYKKRYMANMNM